MKRKYIIILLLLTTEIGFSQSVDFDLINYNGLDFYSTKTEIIETFGQPQKIYEPNYDCGFLSTYSQGEKYLTLDYGKIKFTGNESELYVLEKVNLQKNNSISLKYGNHKLTYETDLNKLIEIFGTELQDKFKDDKNGKVVIFRKKADDGILIEIKNGKLIRFEYWSPC